MARNFVPASAGVAGVGDGTTIGTKTLRWSNIYAYQGDFEKDIRIGTPKGSNKQPIYVSAEGYLTPCTITAGSATKPMYMDNGIIKECTGSFSDYLPIKGGTLTGPLTINSSAWECMSIKGIVTDPTTQTTNKTVSYRDIQFLATDNKRTGVLRSGIAINANTKLKYRFIRIGPVDFSNTPADNVIELGVDSSGTTWSYGTTVSAADSSRNLATTAYVKANVPKNVGSSTKPVYTDANGKVTASSASVGSATTPIYLKNGVLTAGTDMGSISSVPASKGSTTQFVYTDKDKNIVATTATVGSATKPVYMNKGVITECSTMDSMPIGSILLFPKATSIPEGFFICDGRSLSRTTYKALFNVIGTTYGKGDGSTTFNVPDTSGRAVIGYNSSYAVASKGGAASHTITIGEMPAHNHGGTGTISAHYHGVGDYWLGTNNGYFFGYSKEQDFPMPTNGGAIYWNGNNNGGVFTATANAESLVYSPKGSKEGTLKGEQITSLPVIDATKTDSATKVTISSQGSGNSFSIMPPYIAMVYIIKATTGTVNTANLDATRLANDIAAATNKIETAIANAVATVLGKVYPVGCIYTTISSENPGTTLGIGTWTEVSKGRVLMGVTTDQTVGTNVAAGLPNITGSFKADDFVDNRKAPVTTGAIYTTSYSGRESEDGTSATCYQMHIDASRCSSIYGNSTTVQPPAYLVHFWRRTK